MRIILSRKGFDTAAGGVASPILPDGNMVSLPIPSGRFGRRYRDIAFGTIPLGDMVETLTAGRIRASRPCHLDPDLDASAVARLDGWRPAFGQVGAAQTHLANAGVGPGDVFLFFGWFRQVDNSCRRFLPGAPDQHVMFGWLQVEDVLNVGTDSAATLATHPWLADHPHLTRNAFGPNNTVYVATERLVIDGQDLGVPGAGTFRRFHPRLALTLPGESRSIWHLPSWFKVPGQDPTLTYHTRPEAWTAESNGSWRLRTVGRGQEFVIDAGASLGPASAWLASLLAG